MISRWLLPVLLLTSLACAQVPGVAKAPANGAENAAAAAAQDAESDDPLGRSTPRGTVVGFFMAVNNGDYDEAAQYLDTKQQGERARQLVKQLKEVLDRDAFVDIAKLSRQPAGSQANMQPSNRELIGTTSEVTGKIPIYLDRVKQGDGPRIWLFSKETLRQIPDAHEKLGEPAGLGKSLPGWMQVQVIYTPIWCWFVLLVSIPVILLLGSWIDRIWLPIHLKLAHRAGGDDAARDVRSARGPLRLLFLTIILLILGAISPSVVGRSFWHHTGLVVMVIAITWFVARTVRLLTEVSVSRFKRMQTSDKIAIAKLFGRLTQIGALIIGVLVILKMRGINLSAVLTGLGIGGVAVAFAAQKTLENFFGGIMIISDHPIRIGDQCKIGSDQGFVLDIGLRSTRIRTFNRTILTIPNGQLSMMNVENYTLRDKFWFHHIVSLRYDTTAAQVEAVLAGIRKLIEDDSRIETISGRANFIGIGSFSKDIDIWAYILAANYVAFLVAQESLLLDILGIVESAGAKFSLPVQITSVEISGRAVPSAAAMEKPGEKRSQ